MSEKVELIAELKDLVTGKFKDINDQIDKMDAKLANVDKSSRGGLASGMMKSVLSANLLTGAISRAGSAALEFGKDSIQAFAKYEQFQTALTTMFHGNRAEADVLIGQLQTFAKQTPFELTEVQDATKQLLAFGSTSGGVVHELRMLGDVSSGIGAPLGDIAYLYGTIRTQGRAMTMDINQFANRGIPVWKELEKITGKSGMALRKLVEEGKVGFPQIQKVFENLTHAGGQFANLMDAQSKTLGGQISNLSDAWDQLKVHIGASQAGILKSTTDWTTKMVAQLDYQVTSQNFRSGALEKQGYKDNNWFARQFNMGTTGALQDETTNVLAFKENIQEHLAKGEVEMAGALKRSMENQAKNLQFRIGHGSLMERTTGQETNYQELIGRASLFTQGLKDVADMIKVYNKQNKDKASEKADAKNTVLDSAKLDVLAKANRPTQMYVTINELVHELTINSQTLKEGTSESTSLVSKALIMAVNDLSVMNNNR